MNYDEAKNILEKYNQEHILKSYDRLDDLGKEKLLNQISRIDFNQILNLYEKTKEKIEFKDSKIEPIPSIDSENLLDQEKEKYMEVGEEIIKSGKLAVVTMAGGQGTRLGHNGPKGTYDLGLPSHKSLFEILCDGLKKTWNKYGVAVPWYIMTSRENNDATVKFFEEHNYFGYPKESIGMFFKQGELPMIDENGKLIIDENGFIKEAADGHGGVFESLYKNGALDDMKKRGIEWVFIGGVDNVLVRMTDVLFTGFAAANNYKAASKTILKAHPEEKVGVFCKKDGMPYVIEYTEISEEMANERNENGELVYAESHMLLNMFNIEILERIASSKLPYHSAHKKCTYMNEDGEIIKADKPNAYKFEAFLFDAFALLPEVGLYRGKRGEDFSPVKNAEGVDSPETARRDYMKYHNIK